MSKRGKEIAQKNTGIPYEQVTQAIFNQIVNMDPKDVRTIEVLHNAALQGKTLTHHIDVYWKFEVGGLVYQTIVQAKDWESKIKQGHMLEFKGVLDDIPGQPRGIYVTRSGYQRGARRFADACGIDLFVLQPKPKRVEPIPLTSYGFARVVTKSVPVSDEAPVGWVLEMTAYELEFTHLDLQLDAGVMNYSEHPLQSKLGNRESTLPFSYPIRDISVYNLADEQFSNIEDVVKPILLNLKRERKLQGSILHDFKDPTYIRVPGHGERLRIQQLCIEWHFKETRRSITPLDFKDVVSFILERVGKDSRRVFRFRRIPENS
jgi:Restriction endonuclease